MAANVVSAEDTCFVVAHLYRNDKLVGVRGDNWHSRTGVAVTECEEGETLRLRTDENTCHDVWVDPADLRYNWFSVVLITMT